MFKIENISKKSKGNDLDKELLMKQIKEAQREKAEIFLEMGILLHEKIREQEIKNPCFEKMSEELIILDRLIYDNVNKLEGSTEGADSTECECGNIIKGDNKFCSQCGKMLENEEDTQKIECLSCGVKIDIDSNYCVCCGSKLNI